MYHITGHPFYVAVQFHPEYISRPMKASAPYLGLILASCGKLNTYLNRGCRASPFNNFCDDSDVSEDDDISEELTKIHVKSSSDK